MPPSPKPFPDVSYDFWTAHQTNPIDQVQLTCLMPNGIVIQFEIFREATIEEIKEVLFLHSLKCPQITNIVFRHLKELWEKAEKFPLYGHLQDKSMYVIQTIGNEGPHALPDETMRICDVKPYFCLLKIIEQKISTDNLNQNISTLIGKIHAFSLTNPEVNPSMAKNDAFIYIFTGRLRVVSRNDHSGGYFPCVVNSREFFAVDFVTQISSCYLNTESTSKLLTLSTTTTWHRKSSSWRCVILIANTTLVYIARPHFACQLTMPNRKC